MKWTWPAVALLTAKLAFAFSVLIVWCLSHGVSAADTRISLRVTELAGADRDEEIVTSGVPLSRGTLTDASQSRLLDAQGNEVPFVGTVLARWPDESVKWLLLDFRAAVAARQTARFTLECGSPSTAKPTGPQVSVREGDRFIEVTTGPLRFRVSRHRYTFLDEVWLDENDDGAFSPAESVVTSGAGDSRLEVETTPPGPPQEENWLVDAAGGPRQGYEAVVTEARVEFANPLRAVVLVRGEYRDGAGGSIGPFWTRYTAWADDTTIGVEHFFAFDADVEKAFLRSLSLGLPFAGDGPLAATFGLGEGETAAPDAGLAETALVEVMPDRFYHLVPLTVDRRVRYQVVGKAANGGDQVLKEGVEAAGWVRLKGDRATTTIALRDFPRLHPKEIRVEPGKRALRYFLWPERGGKVLDLRRRYKGQRVEDHYDTGEYEPAGRGFGKTHQLLIDFSPTPPSDTAASADAASSADARASALARRADEPLRAFCTPQHYAACDVWNRFQPVDTEHFPQTEAMIRLGIEWALRLPRTFHWDGLVDWGDTFFWGYEGAPHGQVAEVPKTSWVVRGYDGWLNNDCNVAHDFMVLFLRSADDRIYQYWERMVQHVMDVDTIHAAEDPTHVGGGRRHDQQHWGASYTGYGTAAVEAGELYYLTGSLWAKEMLVKYADWYMVGGGAEWETRLPCLVLAWEATGDDKYMRYIERPEMRDDVYGLAMGIPGAIDVPHFRTNGVEVGVDFLYRATGDTQWLDHLTTAARHMIEVNPGNKYGRSLLAKAYLATGDQEVLDWLRRLLVVGDPYKRATQESFFRENQIQDDVTELSFDELSELFRAAPMDDVRNMIYIYRYYPYVMAALKKAGLDESRMELIDFALDRRGMGQYHLRGPDVPAPVDAHFESVSLAAVANTDPLADPFSLYRHWQRHPLQHGEIGFDFGERQVTVDAGECEPGYLPVRTATAYPYRAPIPRAAEHDGTNLIGLPFGTTWQINSVPFALPDPASVADGRTMLVVGKGERAVIPIGRTVRKLYVLGHVVRARSSWRETGARYHLNYADGTTRRIDLDNLMDYEHVFQWGFAERCLFARNWKVQGSWDGGAPILNNYPIECKAKPLEELVIEDAGKGIGFMILAVTAELDGAVTEEPVLDVSFTAPGASKNLWREGSDSGWLNVAGELTESTGVLSDGAATLRTALGDGQYDVELELSGVGWGGPFNVRANGRMVARGYVASSGGIPGVTSRPERIRFPVTVTGGQLDLTLEADRTVGNWWHPKRLHGGAWHLTQMRVFASQHPTPAPREEITYGWLEPDLAVIPLPPDELGSLPYALLRTCIRSKSPSGTFRADLPQGDYEAELTFALRGSGTREGPVKMNVTVQGKRFLTDFDGGSYDKPVVENYPVRIEPDGHLEVRLESAGGENEWGISALVVRPAK